MFALCNQRYRPKTDFCDVQSSQISQLERKMRENNGILCKC